MSEWTGFGDFIKDMPAKEPKMKKPLLSVLTDRELFLAMYETEVAMWDDDAEPGDERMATLERMSQNIASEAERRFGDGAVDCLAQHVVRTKASMRDMLDFAKQVGAEVTLARIARGEVDL